MWPLTMTWNATAIDSEGCPVDTSNPVVKGVLGGGRRVVELAVGKVDAGFTLGILQTRECKEVLIRSGFNVKSGQTYNASQVKQLYKLNLRNFVQDKGWPTQNVREFLRCLIELELGLSFKEK